MAVVDSTCHARRLALGCLLSTAEVVRTAALADDGDDATFRRSDDERRGGRRPNAAALGGIRKERAQKAPEVPCARADEPRDSRRHDAHMKAAAAVGISDRDVTMQSFCKA